VIGADLTVVALALVGVQAALAVVMLLLSLGRPSTADASRLLAVERSRPSADIPLAKTGP
jgi:hypothetical protein